MEWFPDFLKGLKSIAKFLREYKQALCDDLRVLGYAELAAQFDGVRITGFAKWRWGTLHFVCEDVAVVLASLAGVWVSLVFIRKIRENTLIQNVAAVVCMLVSHPSALGHGMCLSSG